MGSGFGALSLGVEVFGLGSIWPNETGRRDLLHLISLTQRHEEEDEVVKRSDVCCSHVHEAYTHTFDPKPKNPKP